MLRISLHFFPSSGRDETIASTLCAYLRRDGQAELAWVAWINTGLPASTVNILQRVQNARFICQLKPREHVTPSLQQLHWSVGCQ